MPFIILPLGADGHTLCPQLLCSLAFSLALLRIAPVSLPAENQLRCRANSTVLPNCVTQQIERSGRRGEKWGGKERAGVQKRSRSSIHFPQFTPTASLKINLFSSTPLRGRGSREGHLWRILPTRKAAHRHQTGRTSRLRRRQDRPGLLLGRGRARLGRRAPGASASRELGQGGPRGMAEDLLVLEPPPPPPPLPPHPTPPHPAPLRSSTAARALTKQAS
jgi:hypothetical protein